jgi:hypothetical protein
MHPYRPKTGLKISCDSPLKLTATPAITGNRKEQHIEPKGNKEYIWEPGKIASTVIG